MGGLPSLRGGVPSWPSRSHCDCLERVFRGGPSVWCFTAHSWFWGTSLPPTRRALSARDWWLFRVTFPLPGSAPGVAQAERTGSRGTALRPFVFKELWSPLSTRLRLGTPHRTGHARSLLSWGWRSGRGTIENTGGSGPARWGRGDPVGSSALSGAPARAACWEDAGFE